MSTHIEVPSVLLIYQQECQQQANLSFPAYTLLPVYPRLQVLIILGQKDDPR